ncbi:MAG TPA: pilus assembly protein [Anaerolineae bacterium]|nr:pilus assembly protein [Anaerolineae bacterium]
MMKTVRGWVSKIRGQSMTEFMLALPIMLLMMFGIVELARLVQAWLAVENAARFGARYAVTGDYDPAYCADANLALGWPTEVYDGFNGDPIDCVVPRAADPINYVERTSMLVDWARLPSIRDAAQAGVAGAWIDEDAEFDEPGFLEIVICSHPSNLTPENLQEAPATIPVCNPVDHPGDPGNPVRVIVFLNHPLIVPFLGPSWPHLSIVGDREMIVETFRTPRALGAPMPLVTATSVPTAANTATAIPCDGLAFMSDWRLVMSGNFKHLEIDITNQSGFNATIDRLIFNWSNYESNAPDQHVDKIFLHLKSWDGEFYASPLDTGTGLDDDLADGESATIIVIFGDNDGDWAETDYVSGDFGVILQWTNGCSLTKHVTVIPAVDTPTPEPPTATPTIDPACIGLSFQNDWQLVMDGDTKLLQINVSNNTGDDVTLDRAIFVWNNYLDYAPYQSVKEIKFEGAKIFRGPASFSPVSSGWGVNEDLDDGQTKTLEIKFDEKDGLWSETDYGPGDFGVTLQFTNGCILERPVTVYNRPTVTPTPLGAECNGLSYVNDWQFIMDHDKKVLEIDVNNASGSNVKLEDAVFYWGNYDARAPSQCVKEIKFEGDKILDVKDYDSPTYTGGDENRKLDDGDTKTFQVKFDLKDGDWSETDYEPGDFGVRLDFDNGCSLFKPVSITDRPTVTPRPPIPSGPEGEIWYRGTTNPEVWTHVEWHTNPDGSVTTTVTFSKNFVDNTYGSNAIGWDDGHTFGELVASDHVQIAFKGLDGSTFFDAKFDYITGAGGCYASMGVSGGDGKLYVGDASWLRSTRVSLAENLCTLGCRETSDSPATDENYTPSAECPGWDYNVWYEITLEPDAFPEGFGYPLLTNIHASPSKTGMNTEPVSPGGTPTPVNPPTPTPTEYICSDC